MDRISINLLPIELKQNKSLEKRKKIVSRISVGFLGSLVLITSGLIVVSVILNRQLNDEISKTEALKTQVLNMKDTEASVVILKNRLATIAKTQNQQYPQTDSFLIVTSMLPDTVDMQSFTVDPQNKVSLQGQSPNAQSLQPFFDNLTNPQINEGKVSKTVINSLSRGPVPQMIFDLTILINSKGVKK